MYYRSGTSETCKKQINILRLATKQNMEQPGKCKQVGNEQGQVRSCVMHSFRLSRYSSTNRITWTEVLLRLRSRTSVILCSSALRKLSSVLSLRVAVITSRGAHTTTITSLKSFPIIDDVLLKIHRVCTALIRTSWLNRLTLLLADTNSSSSATSCLRMLTSDTETPVVA